MEEDDIEHDHYGGEDDEGCEGDTQGWGCKNTMDGVADVTREEVQGGDDDSHVWCVGGGGRGL